MSSGKHTLPRQNFHEETEAGINKHVNLELHAAYVYESMVVCDGGVRVFLQSREEAERHLTIACYFDRDDVALSGFASFFKKASDEEHKHGQRFLTYQNTRGGRIVLQDIKKPDRDEWGSGLEAMQTALQLEKHVNQSLLDLVAVACTHKDMQCTDWIESNFLEEQVVTIKELSNHVATLTRVGTGLGEYMFDKETLS